MLKPFNTDQSLNHIQTLLNLEWRYDTADATPTPIRTYRIESLLM